MDKIIINELELYAFHGVMDEEKKLGQKFIISVELSLDLHDACIDDDINKTVNYAHLCKDIEMISAKYTFDLIEGIAEKLCEFILVNYHTVEEVKITLKKPWAPIHMPINYVAVELTRQWHIAYIGVGSNIGNRNEKIKQALEYVNKPIHTKVTNESELIETKPVGYIEQDDFMNGAVEIKTLLGPKELIRFLKEIEKILKREKTVKWGPRTIDLDVLLYDNMIISTEEIIIPHPRMHERKFVLGPLAEIAPYKIHPILNKRIFELNNEINNDVNE